MWVPKPKPDTRTIRRKDERGSRKNSSERQSREITREDESSQDPKYEYVGGVHSRATQSVLRETNSIALSMVQKSRSMGLRPVQLFWSRRTMA